MGTIPVRIFILPIFAAINCQAQFFQFENIPVEMNNITMPWAGGLNSVQINTFDIDSDGVEDIIAFEKMTNQILPFLVKNNQYQFAPEYAALFPDDISGWMLLRDFNHDGKKDIFTSDISGARVFVNTSRNTVSWRSFSNGNALITKGFTPVNLKINSGDLPVVDDMDGDGDYDILNPRFTGNGKMEWHKNMSIEQTGKTDTLIYERTTQYWGYFTECNCADFKYDPETDCSMGGRIQHAAGKSLLFIDANADGLRDLLFTEENCNNLYLLPNQGTNNDPKLKSFSVFPENHPVDISTFPASYYEDINRDGLKDLVVTSNIPVRNFIKNDFRATLWLYQNSGTNEKPVFSFVKNNLLQENMIDVGTHSCPAFYDADNDGDEDLFVSHFGNSENLATIWFFEHNGSTEKPSFKFISDDYGSLSSKKLLALKIQFSDMDGDGIKDLVFSSYDQTTSLTEISYIKNTSKKLMLSGTITRLQRIFAGENFCVVDVDEDGQQDLLIGKSNGAVQYWRNSGDNNFSMTKDNYLNLGSSLTRQSPSLCVTDVDLDGKSDLLVGNSNGTLSIFSNFRTDTTFQIGKVMNNRTKEYESVSLGGQLTIAASPLLNGKPAIVLGNYTGGLRLLGLTADSKRESTVEFFAYPNPVQQGGLLKMRSNAGGVVRFYNVSGQEIGDEFILKPYEVVTTSPNLAQGIYFVKFFSEKGNIARRIVVLR